MIDEICLVLPILVPCFYRILVSNGFKNYTNIAQSEKSVSKNKWKKKSKMIKNSCFEAISNPSL